MEQMTSLCDMVGQIMQKKEEERRIAEEQAAKDRYWKIPICYDDDDDYTIAITPFFNQGPVENLVPIPSESEGIPDSVCDVPLCNNPTPLEAFKEHSETIIDSNDDSTSSDDDSYENIDYVDASPPDAEIVSLLLASLEMVIRNIKDNPIQFFRLLFMDKSSSHLLPLSWRSKHLEIFTRTETFCFDLEENSSGSTTTHSDYSLPDYEAFYSDDDHIKEKSSGSRYHLLCLIFSKYDSFIFDLSINPFPPTDRNDFYHEEFAGKLAHIISPSEYDSFLI
ncbi:hypothetical protein Tco_0154838 [Tanacetum coccineum]